MFLSKSKDQVCDAPSSRPVAALAPEKRPPFRAASTSSIIGTELVVEGSLTSADDVQIEGRVEGDVKSAGLVVGANAVVHGDVIAEELTVRGRIEGNIRARKVLLCSNCHVEGNILHEAFAVEPGAFFEGNCRHSDSPLAEAPSPKSPALDYRSRPPAGSMAALAPVPPAAVAAMLRPDAWLGDASLLLKQ